MVESNQNLEAGLEAGDDLDLEGLDLGEDKPPVTPSSDPMIEVDGQVYKADDVKRLIDKSKNLESDYTKKTEKLAQERDDVLSEKKELLIGRDRIAQAERDLKSTIEIYKGKPVDEWPEPGKSPIDWFLRGEDGKVADVNNISDLANNPVVKELQEELKILKKDKEDNKIEDLNVQYQDIMKKADELIKGKFNFVTFSSAKNAVYSHYGLNGQVPSETQLSKIIGDLHSEQVQILRTVKGKGSKVDNKGVGQTSGLPAPGVSSGDPVVEGEPVRRGNLPSTQQAIDSGTDFFAKRRRERGEE